MKVHKLVKTTDILTFLNLTCGLLAIFIAVKGRFDTAAFFFIFAALFDFLDGKVSRKKQISNEFGKEIDSLADLVSFGIAPCVFTFLLFKDMRFAPVYILYALAGLVRLARFNITNKQNQFEGLPISVNGVTFPILYFFKPPEFVYYAYLLLVAFLMVSSIKVKKL